MMRELTAAIRELTEAHRESSRLLKASIEQQAASSREIMEGIAALAKLVQERPLASQANGVGTAEAAIPVAVLVRDGKGMNGERHAAGESAIELKAREAALRPMSDEEASVNYLEKALSLRFAETPLSIYALQKAYENVRDARYFHHQVWLVDRKKANGAVVSLTADQRKEMDDPEMKLNPIEKDSDVPFSQVLTLLERNLLHEIGKMGSKAASDARNSADRKGKPERPAVTVGFPAKGFGRRAPAEAAMAQLV